MTLTESVEWFNCVSMENGEQLAGLRDLIICGFKGGTDTLETWCANSWDTAVKVRLYLSTCTSTM